ncbi:MAG: ANTAR domain-containing protein [Acidimicrobiales bacterium]
MDRAKGKLMDNQGMSEADAYRHLQQAAMQQRTTMRAVADAMLASSSDD